jgi:hypothetical protein
MLKCILATPCDQDSALPVLTAWSIGGSEEITLWFRSWDLTPGLSFAICAGGMVGTVLASPDVRG